MAVVAAACLVLGGCGDGVEVGAGTDTGEPADLTVAGADVAEVRAVTPGQPEDGSAAGSEGQLVSSFGAYAEPVGTLTGQALEELVAAVADVDYIDTGDVVLDLANPDYEVVFLADGEELVRLGYYTQVGRWGEYRVPGRWMDENWRLLATTFDLPEELTAEIPAVALDVDPDSLAGLCSDMDLTVAEDEPGLDTVEDAIDAFVASGGDFLADATFEGQQILYDGEVVGRLSVSTRPAGGYLVTSAEWCYPDDY